MKIIKKIIMSVLVFLLVTMNTPSDNLAAEKTDFKETTYNYILQDYLMITELTKHEADNYFKEIKAKDYKKTSNKDIENIIYGKEIEKTYEENILYIQENYNQIVQGITKDEKELIDKFFLDNALRYYEDHGNYDDITETPAIVNFKEMIIENTSFVPEEIEFMENEEFESLYVDENEKIVEENPTGLMNATNNSGSPAIFRIFADGSSSTNGSSGNPLDYGVHAFISISNISNRNILVGRFNIEPGITMTLGTWGNKTEHKGLWYNLENYFINKNGAYNNRVSLRSTISSSNMDKLSAFIRGYDKWSHLNNCSSFAVKSWNEVVSYKLSAGVINTPKNLANSIKGNNNYATNISGKYNYNPYYAQGNGAPKASRIYR